MVHLGIVLLALGLFVAVAGIVRFIQVKRRIGVAYEKLETGLHGKSSEADEFGSKGRK